MCRNIKRLRRPKPPVKREEIEACARHFVSKLSGYRQPSRKNADTFNRAVEEVTRASIELFKSLEVDGEKTCVET